MSLLAFHLKAFPPCSACRGKFDILFTSDALALRNNKHLIQVPYGSIACVYILDRMKEERAKKVFMLLQFEDNFSVTHGKKTLQNMTIETKDSLELDAKFPETPANGEQPRVFKVTPPPPAPPAPSPWEHVPSFQNFSSSFAKFPPVFITYAAQNVATYQDCASKPTAVTCHLLPTASHVGILYRAERGGPAQLSPTPKSARRVISVTAGVGNFVAPSAQVPPADVTQGINRTSSGGCAHKSFPSPQTPTAGVSPPSQHCSCLHLP